MLAGICTSVEAALGDLFGQLDGTGVRVHGCSDRAFAKARTGFSAAVFDHLNATLLALAAPRIAAHRWHGLRVVAADGSRVQLTTRRGAELEADHYAFALYLPGAELTLHASLRAADASERQMLCDALAHTEADDLLVLDRGFTGCAMVATLAQQQRAFCLRVDRCGWACVKRFLASGETQACVDIDAPTATEAKDYDLKREPTRVRLIRHATPTGEVHGLMTSLCDAERYPAADFGDLYHQRWRIEEAFKRLKSRLRLESVSGLTELAAQQDFAAKIVADNLHALLIGADQVSLVDPPSRPNATVTTRRHRPNRTYAIGALKPILIGCLLAITNCLRKLPAALAAIASARVRVQPGRHYPRPDRQKPHAHLAYKLQC